MNGKIGFTEDGYVFAEVLSSIEGKPVQTILQWEPLHAMEVAKALKNASCAAQDIRGKINERNGPNPN